MQWISVKDKKPEYGSKVLVFDFEDQAIYHATFCKANFYFVEDYWACGYTGVVVFKSITHWMPLPLPPEENYEIIYE